MTTNQPMDKISTQTVEPVTTSGWYGHLDRFRYRPEVV
jgi:hypothetical protein